MNERPVALVTGASRGIGAATAEELARRGYDVTVLARTGPDLDRTAKSVQDAGGKSLVQCGDLADLDFAEAAVAALLGAPLEVPPAVTPASVAMAMPPTVAVALVAVAALLRWAAVVALLRWAAVVVEVVVVTVATSAYEWP